MQFRKTAETAPCLARNRTYRYDTHYPIRDDPLPMPLQGKHQGHDMSDLFFFDTNEAPQPRDRVKITELTATPYPDGSRVRIKITLTPFLERPNLEIYAKKTDGPIVAELSVIEPMTPLLEFTLHIRGAEELAGDYLVRAELFYDDRTSPQDARETSFQIVIPEEQV